MKKLLFTLATLLMAGGMFAGENYCFIEDFTITQDQLGTEIEVPIAIHADDAFSAYQADFVFPDGLTIVEFMEGADATVQYYTNTGRSRTATAQPGTNEALTRILAAFQAAGYVQAADGTWQTYGAISWMAGDYEEVAIAIFEVSEDFKGGEIEVVSKLSHASNDNTQALIGDVANGTAFTKICTVTVEGGQLDPADEPVITFTPGETGVTITVDPYTSYEVIVNDVNKGQINFVEKDWVAQHIVVNATNAPAGYEPATNSATYDLGVKDNYELEGDITIGAVDENGKVYVTYTGDEEVTLTATVDGVAVDVVDGYIQLPEYGEYEIEVTATPTAEHTNAMTKKETREWVEPEVADTPVITFTEGATGLTIDVEPATSWIVIVDGVEKGQINFVEKTWETQTVHVVATNAPTGYTPATAEKETTLGPKDNYELEGTITIGGVDENGKVYVSYEGDEEVTLTATVDGEAVEIVDGYIQLPEYGVYEIEVTATPAAEHTNAMTKKETREWVEPDAAETPVITFTEGTTGLTIDVDPATSWVVYVDGVDKGQINFVEKTWETQTVKVVATNAPNGYTPATAEKETTLGPKDPMDLSGEIIFGAVETDGRVSVMYTGNEAGVTLTVTCDKLRGELDIVDGYVQLPEYGTFKLTGTAKAEHYNDLVEVVERTWEATPYQTPAPEFGDPEITADNWAITATGEGTVTITVQIENPDATYTTLTFTGDGEATAVIPRTTEDQYINYWATAQKDADSYPGQTGVEYGVKVPKKDQQQQQTAAPGDDLQNKVVKFGDVYYNTYELTLIETEPSTIYYRVGTLNPETGLYEYTDWMTYEDMLTYTTPGTYMVEAYAVADGKTQSTTIQVGFSVSEATSIEELFADKNIASVRYFNMAGQEMQEANGICVTVYTFTDGTQTAIKVMK